MTTSRYRRRPIEVDTIQWTGNNEAEVQAFTGGASNFYALDEADRRNSDDPEATATVFDKLHSTWVLVYTGQHIVRGVKGEYYPIAEDVLAETYEPADTIQRCPQHPDAYGYEHPECGFHWHGRDGMDVPLRDGQPVCPRCELQRAPVSQSAVYHEAAKVAVRAAGGCGDSEAGQYAASVAAGIGRELRRLADEATATDQTETIRLHDEILAGKAEIAELRDLIGKESQRANAAIDREETAEQAATEAQAVVERVREVPSFVEKVIALSGPGVATYKVREIAQRLNAALDGTEPPAAAPAVDRAYLVDIAAQAIRDSNGSPEALEWWKKHPQLIPAHVYAAAVLAVLADTSRAAVYAEVADRLAADAETGDKEGFTRIYRRSAARKVREWGDELRRMDDEEQQP